MRARTHPQVRRLGKRLAATKLQPSPQPSELRADGSDPLARQLATESPLRGRRTIPAAKPHSQASTRRHSWQKARPHVSNRFQITVDESRITATYTNFCRVTGTPYELIVDFGLNHQVGGTSPETIQLTQRIIVNFYTAKRLAYAFGPRPSLPTAGSIYVDEVC